MAFDFSSDQNKNYLQTINQNAPDAGSALKVLSLNLPNFLGGSPIAPDALLRPGLSTSAQVGGTAPLPTSLSPAPTAAPTAAPVIPTSTAPIASMASNLIAPQAPAAAPSSPFQAAQATPTTAAPPAQAAPAAPSIQFGQSPTSRPDLGALLGSLLQGAPASTTAPRPGGVISRNV